MKLEMRFIRNKIFFLTIYFLFIITIASGTSMHTVCKNNCDHTSIQQAVDTAQAGDIIEVKSGTYLEKINITKQLILLGVNTGNDQPYVISSGYYDDAITLSADGIKLEGFNVESSKRGYGIKVVSNNNIISYNTFDENFIGISLFGSSNNILTGNNVINNKMYGIYLENSNKNNFVHNKITIKNNAVAGLLIMLNSNENTFGENSIIANIVALEYGMNIWDNGVDRGNHYGIYDEISEGCSDNNLDDICDSPYIIKSQTAIDNFPLKSWNPLPMPDPSPFPDPVPVPFAVWINITGIPVIGTSTKDILKVEYRNFSLNDPCNISITAPNGTRVYYDSGNLTGANPEIIPINWTPSTTGNHTIEAWGRGMIDSTPVYIYDSAVVTPTRAEYSNLDLGRVAWSASGFEEK